MKPYALLIAALPALAPVLAADPAPAPPPVTAAPTAPFESWMIGRFIGVNEGMDGHVVALLISPSGHVIAVADGSTVFRGQMDGNLMAVDENRFLVARTDEGLSTTQVGNETNVVYYQRE
jgi:hypothetical protein